MIEGGCLGGIGVVDVVIVIVGKGEEWYAHWNIEMRDSCILIVIVDSGEGSCWWMTRRKGRALTVLRGEVEG